MSTDAERTSAAMKDISKKSLQVKNSAANPIAKPSNDLMGSLTDEFHTANEVARKSQVASPKAAVTTASKPTPQAAKAEEDTGCFGCFGGSKKKEKAYAPPPERSSNPKQVVEAMNDIARRSRQVQQTNSVARVSSKPASLMDVVTDEFHEAKAEIEKQSQKAGKKAGEVWD